MNDRYFLDTNIFIYSFDENARSKAMKARELIGSALKERNGCIGTQVIQEFLNIATRKFKKPLNIKDSKQYLQKVLVPLCEVYPDTELFENGLDIQSATGYSFYDSLIIAAARKGGCGILYSEDLQDERSVYGITIINPFRGL